MTPGMITIIIAMEVAYNNPDGAEILLRKAWATLVSIVVCQYKQCTCQEDRDEEFYFAPTKAGKKGKAKNKGRAFRLAKRPYPDRAALGPSRRPAPHRTRPHPSPTRQSVELSCVLLPCRVTSCRISRSPLPALKQRKHKHLEKRSLLPHSRETAPTLFDARWRRKA